VENDDLLQEKFEALNKLAQRSNELADIELAR
jgi:hypothetical protein